MSRRVFFEADLSRITAIQIKWSRALHRKGRQNCKVPLIFQPDLFGFVIHSPTSLEHKAKLV